MVEELLKQLDFDQFIIICKLFITFNNSLRKNELLDDKSWAPSKELPTHNESQVKLNGPSLVHRTEKRP